MTQRQHVVVVFSGGPDSTAAALWALEQGLDVHLLTFQFRAEDQYGELYASMKVAESLRLRQTIIDWRSPMDVFSRNVHILMHAGTPPKGADLSKPHRLPFGAGVVLSTAAAFALYRGLPRLVWGATYDDAFGGNIEYTQEFADGIADLVARSHGTEFRIDVPFAKNHKYDVFKYFRGKEDLFAQTWSCKLGSRTQSGKCHACVARRLAAEIVALKDFTTYEATDYVRPLSAEQIANIETLSDDDLVHIFESEKAEFVVMPAK